MKLSIKILGFIYILNGILSFTQGLIAIITKEIITEPLSILPLAYGVFFTVVGIGTFQLRKIFVILLNIPFVLFANYLLLACLAGLSRNEFLVGIFFLLITIIFLLPTILTINSWKYLS